MTTQFHYYVTHGLGWATGDTLTEAIEAAFCTTYYGDMRNWLLNCHKNDQLGIPFFTCRVPLEKNAPYQIENFVPQVEGVTECKNFICTYVTQKAVAYARDPNDRIRELEKQLHEWGGA